MTPPPAPRFHREAAREKEFRILSPNEGKRHISAIKKDVCVCVRVAVCQRVFQCCVYLSDHSVAMAAWGELDTFVATWIGQIWSHDLVTYFLGIPFHVRILQALYGRARVFIMGC